MTDRNQNPFILPGLGQGGEIAGNPLLASMEMMRQAWQAMAGVGGGRIDAGLGVPMSVEDLDRRIKDLRAVENWLKLNLSMLSSTIQGLEVQSATMTTFKTFMDRGAAQVAAAVGDTGDKGGKPEAGTIWPGWPMGAGDEHGGKAGDAASGASSSPAGAGTGGASSSSGSHAWAGGGKADAGAASSGAGSQADQGGAGGAGAAAGQTGHDPATGLPPDLAAQAMAASKGWWDMLQNQFDNLAAATAATLQGAGAQAAGAMQAATAAQQAANAAAQKAGGAAKRASASSSSTRGRAAGGGKSDAAGASAKRPAKGAEASASGKAATAAAGSADAPRKRSATGRPARKAVGSATRKSTGDSQT